MPEIDYFFEFADEATALNDPTVAPLLSDPTTSRKNIWAFDVAVSPPAPPRLKPTPYWCMVAQLTSNAALLAHQSLQYFLVLPATALYQNFGNNEFRAISVDSYAARYAKNWSFGLGAGLTQGTAIITPSGLLITDLSGNALMVAA